MNFSQMEYFLAVAKHLNFTAAAKSLYISQPALSKQIALLEEELGTRLFLRNSRAVALTEAGRQFEKDLIQIANQLQAAKKHAIEIGKSSRPLFKIACFDGATVEDFLPAFYRHLENTAPHMQISLFRGSFAENKKALENDEVDLLLTLSLDLPYDENYKTRPILRRHGALIYSEKSSLSGKKGLCVTDFKDEPYLVLKSQLSPRLFENGVSNLKRLGIQAPKICEIDNFATLLSYLEIGQGYALLTGNIVDTFRGLKKIDLDDDTMGTDIVAVWKADHPFAQILIDTFSVV
ncbi:MAG: LysR family transcriptional regulator [Clostridiales bacterium]|nr:LysR family transcriptional regulator [Clostridiales bacterium]